MARLAKCSMCDEPAFYSEKLDEFIHSANGSVYCPDKGASVISVECECFLVPEHMWTTHYGAVEPGSTHEFNPDCPVHAYDLQNTENDV